MVTPEDYETAQLVVEQEPWVFTVPSLSESIPDGDPVLRVVRATGNATGSLSMECDCPGNYLGGAFCRHKRAVVAWLRLHPKDDA